MSGMERGESVSNVSIRNYDPEKDFEAVRDNLMTEGMFDDDWDAEEKLRDFVQKKPNGILVATIDDKVVGSVFQTDLLYPYIYRLIVDPNYRRVGIGDRIMNAVEEQLKKLGHDQVGIFVDESHEEAKQWYLKRGFQPTGLYRAMYKDLK